MLYRDIPDDVWNLLQDRIAGLDELKALLLVSGDPSKSWTASSVATELGTRTPWIEVVLAKLCAAGLLVGQGEGMERRFSYRPDTPALAAAVRSLAQIYDQQRVNVILILSNKAMNRIRQAAYRTFASSLGKRNEPPQDDG